MTDKERRRRRSRQPLLYGIEVEVECPDGSDKEYIAEMGFDSSFWYFKHDGSLSYGVEIVSHPASFEHWDVVNWSGFERLIEEGWNSFKTTTCGMHVHVGKNRLSGLDTVKLMSLFQGNAARVEAISRRNPDLLRQWASVYRGDRLGMVRKVRGEDPNKYEAINVTNYSTIEFRIFRGTLKPEGIMRNLAFVHACCLYVKETELPAVPNWAVFSDWMKTRGQELFPRKWFRELMNWRAAGFGNSAVLPRKESARCV